jgi:hypothetical protein
MWSLGSGIRRRTCPPCDSPSSHAERRATSPPPAPGFVNVPRRRIMAQRELDPCLDRERVASLPLDDGANVEQHYAG